MDIKKHKLNVHNSLSGKKESFQPLNKEYVGMYVCGPTVYSDVHLGNCRTFISFDMIYRYLTYLGYTVRYVRNITDAGHLENDADEGEDKISKKARLEQLEPMEIVQKYTVGFRNIMEAFNSLPPSIEPTATGHIIEQIEMIKDIISKGLAYESNGSVYFDVPKYQSQGGDYGVLSGRNTDELFHNTRELDGQSEKQSPLDFSLWKKASPSHIMRWPSPWSIGFPGWHLECSVMSTKYLGDQFDIHGGGMDLKFPHHECEIAQCQAHTEKAPVKYWLHANMLTLNGKRMSKSTGNTILPQELFTGENELLVKGFDPSVVRFFMMQAHYRSILDFSNEALLASEKGFMRLMDAIAKLDGLSSSASVSEMDVDKLITKSLSAMDDDFNTPILLAELFEAVKWINSISEGKLKISDTDLARLSSFMKDMVFFVLALKSPIEKASTNKLDSAMQLIIELRRGVRVQKNWALSDQIRDHLAKEGIQLNDGPEGTHWTIN